jgi:hypothetical protein
MPQEKPIKPSSKPNVESRPASQRTPPNPPPGNEAIAKRGKYGEGSYEATRRYDDGLEQFSKSHPVDESMKDAKKIDTDDEELKRAERKAKEGPRPSAPSVP